jgi:hypothetical protein
MKNRAPVEIVEYHVEWIAWAQAALETANELPAGEKARPSKRG